MTTLAARLNELASANEKGLLNDDEYRILRQDAFERYTGLGDSGQSDAGAPFIGSSNLSLSQPIRLTATTSTQSRLKPTRRPSDINIKASPSTLSEKDKKSSNNVIASFIRRATSPLRPSASSPGPSNIPSSSSRKTSYEYTISRSDSRKNHKSNHPHSHANPVPDPHLLSPPTSPTRPLHHTKRTKGSSSPTGLSSTLTVSSTKPVPLSAISNPDIFEDGGLFTSADIRIAISELDEDAKRVIHAFDELQDSAIRRAKSKAQSSRTRSNVISPSSSSANPLSLPTLQHRDRADSAATPSGSGSSSLKPIHTRARSRSTTSIQPMPVMGVPHKSHPNLTARTASSTHTPTLQRKGSVSSLASSLLSLKSKASMPSLPSIPSIPSISTMPSMIRSRSGSVTSTNTYHNNPSNSILNASASLSGYSTSNSGRSMEKKPSMSNDAGSYGHGRSSTSTGTSSIHTSTSTSSTGRTSISSGHGNGYSPATPSPTTATARSHTLTRSNPKSNTSGSIHFKRDSTTESGQSYPSGSNHRSGDALEGLDEVENMEEIIQIQQRRRDVIGRYDARREYLKARLRGAELHERVMKGR
ncbi:hypothetical protein F5880DRAFT_225407 [Lentinula raphanica]|nr:hypothetical protein F5880DRAFT_225407 [Lentinula raphanica]